MTDLSIPTEAPHRDLTTMAAAVADAVIDLRDPALGQPLAAFVDDVTGLTLELHHPLARPDRWRAYLDGLETQYRQLEIGAATCRSAIADGRSTPLFFVAVDEHGRVVGGIRCHGPLAVPEEAYAMLELAGHPELAVVRGLFEDRIGEGLVEVKGAWIDPAHRGSGLGPAFARCHVHAMAWLGARYGICTCSDKLASRWASAGGFVRSHLETVAYPDERFRTVVVWFDSERPETATPDQLARIRTEQEQLGIHRPGSPPRRVTRPVQASAVAARPATPAWQAEILDPAVDDARLQKLLADPALVVLDAYEGQLVELRKIRPAVTQVDDSPRWVHYPWRRTISRVLAREAFRAVRLDRNRNKITAEEQLSLARLDVGIVGLSVGHSIAHALALEGLCGTLRLADFDDIELSNLNRIPATVLDIGVNKAIVVGRRIAELDPYLDVQVWTDGLTASNVEAFMRGLDVVVEECDSLDVKVLVREVARAQGIPVLMETSDRGLLDVERFDLDGDRPLFHGLLGDVASADLVGLSTHDKVPHVLRILEPEQLSSRMAASMAEIDETLTTWPQLGGDVTLGAATIAACVRALGQGRDLPSGRVRVDLDATLRSVEEPQVPSVVLQDAPTVPSPPVDAALAVAHAASLAPSGGNAQPWFIDLRDGALDVALDRSRTSRMDVQHRGSYVAIGAALLNARTAAAAHGVLGDLELFPDTSNPDLVGRLSLGARFDLDLGGLYAGVLDRSTNRRPGSPAPIPDEVAATLHREVETDGARLHLLTSGDEVGDYAELLAESDRLRFLTPALHAEMMSELKWPGQDELEVGLDVRTLELDGAELAKLSVARRPDVMAELAAWEGGRALGDISRDRVPTSSGIAVVTVGDSEPASYVRGGGALQRLWLAANAAGLAVQPVSPVCVFAVDEEDYASLVAAPYVERLRAVDQRIRRLAGLGDEEHVVLIVRLSHAAPVTARSLRQPLEATLLRGAGR